LLPKSDPCVQHVFRFADTDLKLANKALKSHEDELTRVLKDTMPGLVQASSENATYSLSSVGSEDRLLGAGKRHRLLIRPDAFHVSVLFQPTLAFLDRITEVLPSGMETARSSTNILDDFVLKVYLPQLEEKVSLLFHQSVTGLCRILFTISSFHARIRHRCISNRSDFDSIVSRATDQGVFGKR
jgi:exocyst complex component 4